MKPIELLAAAILILAIGSGCPARPSGQSPSGNEPAGGVGKTNTSRLPQGVPGKGTGDPDTLCDDFGLPLVITILAPEVPEEIRRPSPPIVESK